MSRSNENKSYISELIKVEKQEFVQEFRQNYYVQVNETSRTRVAGKLMQAACMEVLSNFMSWSMRANES